MLRDHIKIILMSGLSLFMVSTVFGHTESVQCDPHVLGEDIDPELQATLQKLGLSMTRTSSETQNAQRNSIFDAIDRHYFSSEEPDEGTFSIDFYDNVLEPLTIAEAFKKVWESTPDTRAILRDFANKAEAIKNRPLTEATSAINNILRPRNLGNS